MSDSKLKSKQSASNSKETQLKKGTLVEAKDFSNTWYKSRITEIDTGKKRVKVHFLGWNSRYDQWFDLNGPDIKVIDTYQKTHSSIKSKKANVSVKQNLAVRDVSKSETYEIGAKVSAKWRFDDMFYPADVLRSVMKGNLINWV